ncbi:60S ribosomal protein [Musa troglodytarum]|uniref:60S ribosomal protein n=1 Tax=Musa troglodytarum TaxID=320322 RepID=A0A9E7L9D7_9LILI|nr:60S ribosomal protein [Musa troglodytarum]
MSEESKDKPQCSTFHGASDHAQPASISFPLPVPPPGLTITHSPSPAPPAGFTAAQPPFHAPPQQPLPPSYAHDYQAAPGCAHVVEGRPETLPSLPCCGLGIGWKKGQPKHYSCRNFIRDHESEPVKVSTFVYSFGSREKGAKVEWLFLLSI